MECPECGAVASAEDLFCGECGTVLADPLSGGAAGGGAVDLPPPPVLPSPPPPPARARPAQDTRANVAFILGIVSIGAVVLSCMPFFGITGCVSPVTGIIAIILGAVVKRDIEARGGLEGDRQKAHRGMVLGIVGVALYCVFLAIGIVFGIGLSILSEL